MNMDEEIKTYKEAVAHLAASKVNATFQNDGPDHALLVFEQIFTTAEKTISIVAGSLCGEFTAQEEYRKAVNDFLDKPDVSLRVLLHDIEHMTNSAFFAGIRERSNVEVRRSDDEFRAKDDNTLVHFCVGDDRMYRLEYDTCGRRAVCNFNDTVRVKSLSQAFDSFFGRAEIVNLKSFTFSA